MITMLQFLLDNGSLLLPASASRRRTPPTAPPLLLLLLYYYYLLVLLFRFATIRTVDMSYHSSVHSSAVTGTIAPMYTYEKYRVYAHTRRTIDVIILYPMHCLAGVLTP